MVDFVNFLNQFFVFGLERIDFLLNYLAFFEVCLDLIPDKYVYLFTKFSLVEKSDLTFLHTEAIGKIFRVTRWVRNRYRVLFGISIHYIR